MCDHACRLEVQLQLRYAQLVFLLSQSPSFQIMHRKEGADKGRLFDLSHRVKNPVSRPLQPRGG